MCLVKKCWENCFSVTACSSENGLYEGTGKGVSVFDTCEGVELDCTYA